MNCIVWNARGLGSPSAFHELRRLIATHSPDIIFISESKMTSSKCNRWRYQLGFNGQFVVDAEGKSGGLILLWKDTIEVLVSSFSRGHIDCLICWEGRQWRFTGFYGHPDRNLRKWSWKLLNRLHQDLSKQSTPWLVGGDFNEILFQADKIGGKPRESQAMEEFAEALMRCGLKDLQERGAPPTWFNKQLKERAIFEKLDRFVSTSNWRDMFVNFEIQTLDFYGSDHTPLLLKIHRAKQLTIRGEKGRFYFEGKWMLEKNFLPDFLQEWKHSSFESSLPDRLLNTQVFLTSWAGTRFDAMKKHIKELRKEREAAMKNANSRETPDRIKEIDTKLEDLLSKEEFHWKQRGRVNWLRYGDRNTSLFHAHASHRRKKNWIKGIYNQHNVWIEDEDDIANDIMHFYSQLFKSTAPDEQDIEYIKSLISTKLSEDTKNKVGASFTDLEVKRAIFDMHPTKAPGPDGYPAFFFHKLWPAIGDDVTKAVLNILNGDGDLSEWNKTLVVLIPKVQTPKRIQEYRPISLCNTIYKIVAKAIVHRLRRVLDVVIDQTQSAFVPGRLISDNILIGFECMHWLRNLKKRKNGFCALKLDMSKAYDRVEWSFLKGILIAMNFPESLIQLIMKCVRTVSYTFTFNNK